MRGDHNIVVGDVSPDCPGQEPGHTGARELLWISTRGPGLARAAHHGEQARAPAPGSCSHQSLASPG